MTVGSAHPLPGMRARTGIALGVVIAVAAALRFVELGEQSLWFDEWVAFQVIDRDFVHMLQGARWDEASPPLYHVLAWLWVQPLGIGDASLRSFSAAVGTATVPAAYLAATWLSRSSRAGLVAAALTATSPILVWYSQEARPYALLVLLCTLSFAFFARALQRPSRRNVAAWGITAALAAATHYYAAFLIVVQVAWMLDAERLRLPAVRAALGAIALAGAGLSVLLLVQLETAHHVFRAIPLVERLEGAGREFLVGFAAFEEALWVPALALVAVAAVLLLRRGDPPERSGALVAAGAGLGSVALAVVAALVGQDFIITRNLLPALPPLIVATGIGFAVRRGGRVGPAAAGALCVLGAVVAIVAMRDPDVQRADWRGVSAALGRLSEGQRLVILPGDYLSEALWRYSPNLGVIPRTATVEVQEVAVVGVEDVERRSACHVGMKCSLRKAPLAEPELPGGFVRRSTTRVDLFTVVRYQAPRRLRVRVDRVIAGAYPGGGGPNPMLEGTRPVPRYPQ